MRREIGPLALLCLSMIALTMALLIFGCTAAPSTPLTPTSTAGGSTLSTPDPWVLQLSATPVTLGTPTVFQTTMVSGGVPARLVWNFGDGTVDADGSWRMEHLYRMEGRFITSLIATDASGRSVTTSVVAVVGATTQQYPTPFIPPPATPPSVDPPSTCVDGEWSAWLIVVPPGRFRCGVEERTKNLCVGWPLKETRPLCR